MDEVGRKRFPPLGSLKIKHVYHEVPAVVLHTVGQKLPCEVCRERVARGKDPLPLHPACAAHLRAGIAP